jgi:4-nitrophenyl phosphatase
VVVGWDGAFDYSRMRAACLAVRAGAELIATNSDATFPAPDGLWPGAGAILASIEVSSGRRAEVLGKPHAPMMDAAARRLEGCERIAIVGDRADTDLAGGISRGWKTILVTSGVTTPEEALALDPQPDLILGSLAEL